MSRTVLADMLRHAMMLLRQSYVKVSNYALSPRLSHQPLKFKFSVAVAIKIFNFFTAILGQATVLLKVLILTFLHIL